MDGEQNIDGYLGRNLLIDRKDIGTHIGGRDGTWNRP